MTIRQYIGSKYNYKVTSDDPSQSFLFNCLKGGFIKLPKSIDTLLEDISTDNPLHIDDTLKENVIFSALLEGGFIIPTGYDELKIIEENFNSVPTSQILTVTIAPTLNCNLACYYCYQKHNEIQLNKEICDKIILQIEQKLSRRKYKKLRVDWYGGEPLLAFESIQYLSEKLIHLTSKQKIEYTASMVTNGTRLTPSVVESLIELKVDHVQITLDGPPVIHNKNRPFKGGNPSFHSVLNGIKSAANKMDLSIRVNVNKETLTTAYELLDLLSSHVVFSNKKKMIPYISMIGPLSTECKNVAGETIPTEDFYKYVLDFQKEVLKRFPNLEVEDVMEIPRVLYRACGAQNPNSICIHPSGQVFKCGIDIHDNSLGASFIWEDYYNHSNYKKWVNLNPLKIKECTNCKFLPLCMGGCAKHNFQEGHFYERDSCIHWNAYLDLILKQIIELKKERNEKSIS